MTETALEYLYNAYGLLDDETLKTELNSIIVQIESQEHKDEIIVIRTEECDICQRFDSIMMTREETKKKAYETDLGIGAFTLKHNDHWRVIYFDEKGSYLGDTISLKEDEIPYNKERHEVDIYEGDSIQ